MIDQIDKSIFTELKSYVFELDVKAIDKWFESHSDKPQLESSLVHYIFNEVFFFSYQSNLTGTATEMNERLNQEDLSRHRAILSHFSLESQISLFSSQAMNDRLTPEQFKLLKYTPESKNLILGNAGIAYTITRFFNKEQFQDIEEIETILDINLLENKSPYFAVYRKEKNTYGGYYIQDKNCTLAPCDDIVFNYTKEKKDYLSSRGIELKDFKAATELRDAVLDYITKSDYLKHTDYADKLQRSTEHYITNTLYLHLSKSIEEKPIKKLKKI